MAKPRGYTRNWESCHGKSEYSEVVDDIIPLTSLFAKKEEQQADSSHQQRRIEELNSVERQLLASGPVYLDLRRTGNCQRNMYLWLYFAKSL